MLTCFRTHGRHDEALIEIRRARELDPVNLVTNALEGQILTFAGKDDEALRVLQATAEMDSNFWLTPLFMTRVYLKRGAWDDAIAAATKARDLSHGNSEAMALIGFAQARAGNTAQAREILRELEERAKVRYVPSYTLAQLYTALGEKEKALDLLEISFTNRDALMAFLKVEPKWDPLRSEPRFIELLKRMNLG
jgi:tetratricopeptide (TPR) repeat protein